MEKDGGRMNEVFSRSGMGMARGKQRRFLAGLAAFALGATSCAWAQYPGQVTSPAAKAEKNQPTLRAISVVEWTGDFAAPKAARLVPVLVVEGDQLHDASTYLARPQPLAIAGEVEYELEQNGKIAGLFDIEGAAQDQGVWVGYGKWKKPPAPQAKPNPLNEMAKLDLTDEASDRPVLHRKHPAGGAKSSEAGKSGPAAGPEQPAADPDRPTLHKKDSSSGTDDTGAKKNSPDETPDPDQPTLHRHSSDAPAAADADRPKLKKGKKKDQDVGHTDALAGVTDPDRPKLRRGKADADAIEIKSSLVGMPAEMGQTMAVSDLRQRPTHEWSYRWADAADEPKMKTALEEMAREALGLKPPTPPEQPPAPKKTTGKKAAKPAAAPPPEPPAPLEDEQFRVFELAYGSGATLVLSARSAGAAPERKYVTLIAQPDFYGNLQVVLKSVTDAAHLDERPRMRLIDAVDALADNRGELLFEMRGASGRQFALYRVLRGRAEQIFLGAGGDFAIAHE
jgi:hypothetical protein